MRPVLFLALAALLLAACGNTSRREVLQARYYQAYYDGYYGPFIDGYWGQDESHFWFKDSKGVWRRDTGHHFQRGDGGVIWTLVRGSGVARTNR